MGIIKDTPQDFDIRYSTSIFDIYFLTYKKVKPYALQYNFVLYTRNGMKCRFL